MASPSVVGSVELDAVVVGAARGLTRERERVRETMLEARPAKPLVACSETWAYSVFEASR